ncbi:MAG TPA: methyltransferase domain-containing protein [Ghiorsea sp.]|nr:methyltransferase domain-containing protein [Ghiorsea sp.]HIP06564.1 methyltransferase domain-containing protein [Mariprofundaceae bacterium]
MPDWESLYQAQDTGWDRGGASPALLTFMEKGALESAKTVLIPGCGRGYEVVELARRGFAVTALDLAPSAVTHLKQTLETEGLKAEVICTDIFDFKTSQAFDVVYEQTCLCAIEPSEREAYAKAVFGWLKPKGKLLLNMMQTGDESGPPFHCDWMDIRKLFPVEQWVWQEEPPFMTSRNRQSPRFELGYILEKKP